jgi:hypothetical protein
MIGECGRMSGVGRSKGDGRPTMTRRLLNELVVMGALAAVPTLALGQATLTELGAANAARNQMMANSAGTGADAGAAGSRPAPTGAAASTGRSANYGMKYALSYALTGLLIGLGLYLVCRPGNRHEAD